MAINWALTDGDRIEEEKRQSLRQAIGLTSLVGASILPSFLAVYNTIAYYDPSDLLSILGDLRA